MLVLLPLCSSCFHGSAYASHQRLRMLSGALALPQDRMPVHLPPLRNRPPRSDLKAENVLQAADGRWVLCDFGSVSTQHGVLAGGCTCV